MTACHELVAICQTPGSIPSHSPLHSRSIKQGSKDCWHLVEALGSATWPISHCIVNKGWVDKTTNLRFPNFLVVERRLADTLIRLLEQVFRHTFWVHSCCFNGIYLHILDRSSRIFLVIGHHKCHMFCSNVFHCYGLIYVRGELSRPIRMSVTDCAKWHPIPYIVHYFWPESFRLCWKVVHYIRNRVRANASISPTALLHFGTPEWH